MQFEDLENLWNVQQPSSTGIGLAELKRRLAPELRRRSRMFLYRYFFLALGLIVFPALTLVNFLHTRPENGALYLLNALVVVSIGLIGLIGTIRQHRRHRALSRVRTETISTFLATSIANLESEMRDLRLSRWGVALVIAVPLLGIYVNHPVTKFGWGPFLIRAGMMLGVALPVVAVFARHYLKILKPELARRKKMLEPLS